MSEPGPTASTSRRLLVVGNWKMNTSQEEAHALAAQVAAGSSGTRHVELVLCPPFPWLVGVQETLAGSAVTLGAQHMHFQEHGAFTGEVSPRMLAGLCRYVLLGQYERRIHFQETDWLVARKMAAAAQFGPRPILCVGDTIDQREDGDTAATVARQIESALEGLAPLPELVVAYDPAWTTIGRAMPPPADFAGQICGHIRDVVGDLMPQLPAASLRVIYGGPVSPANAAGIAAQAGVDGLLAGSASLRAESFLQLVQACEQAAAER
ncbi:MAG: triose-phosphate isomerase, partial [Chloroflexota bacterium]